ncbi:CST complex subunit TEN1 isoform X3 [Stegostoma tigrinum]|uniref:CST complex subunit TEN1 isoform X3 n=1 Tax=Stegostoma tigrinum TaxID=3053191 RepID=UPI00202B5B78|nr:CST complex subunit TEN1 isoform X3 [Stegostoma tigrinum]
MLPQAGEFHFLWEICSGGVEEGNAVRTFGRLTTYDARISEAILSVHHSSTDYQLRVRTSLVEPFEARIGSEYMVLGEIETSAVQKMWKSKLIVLQTQCQQRSVLDLFSASRNDLHFCLESIVLKSVDTTSCR